METQQHLRARSIRAIAPGICNFRRYNERAMKAYVYVSLKRSVLDPQGKTIHGALKKMGYRGVGDVRQGKYFELQLDAANRQEAEAEIDRIAKEVLTNPVIEEYRYTLEL